MAENNEMMMEETIPAETVEESTDDDFVLELEEDESTEETASEENAAEEETQETEEQTTQEVEMFPGDFELDGQARAVTMAEAPGLIQKGLLYGQLKDKYMGKLKDAYADPRIAFVDELAKSAGVEVSEYIANSRMRNEYAGLLETYGNMESVPEAVMKLFSDNAKANKDNIAKALSDRQQKQWEQQKAEEYEAFMENHPEVKEIPQDVVQLVHKGESLEGAYAISELAKAKEQIAKLTNENKILTQNNKNKQTKLPSAQSSAVKEDDMVWEFN